MASTKHVKLTYRVLHNLGLKQNSDNPEVDAAQHRYDFLRAFVDELRGCLEAYVVQMEHLGETTRALGDVITHMYTPADEGYKAVVGYRAVQEEGFTGYVNHLREALVKGVIADAAAWQRQVRALDDHVQRFKAARLRYDYYSKKVDEIRTGLSAAAEKGKDLTQLHDRLQRNLIKLDEVKLEYDRASKDTCSALNKAWQERIPILTALLTRLVRFEESKHSHCLSQAFGLSQLLGTSAAAAAAALEAAWVGSNGGVRTGAGDAEAYLPMDAVKHHEGPLLRKGTVMKTKIYCRLVGSLLHAYDFSDENCSASATGCNHGAVLLEPRAVYDVTGVENAGEAAFRVQVDGGKELLLAALTPEEGPAWGEALARAASWDAQACLAHMSQLKRAVQTFREEARARRGDPSLPEVERALGVTAALARPPPPPPPGMPPPLEPPQRLSLTAGTAPPRQAAVSLGGSLKAGSSAFFARGAAAEAAAARDGGDRGGASSGNGAPAAEEAETRRGIVRRLTGLSPFNRHSGGGGGSTKDMASSTAIAGTVYAASGGGGVVSLSRRSSESTGGSGAVTACMSPVARTESVATVNAAAPSLHGGDAATADLHTTAHFSSAPPGLAQPAPPPLPAAQSQRDSSPPPALQPYTEADPAHVREAFTALAAAAAARANSAAAAAAATATGGTAAAAWTYSGGTGTGRRSSGSSAGSGGGGGACGGITLGAVLEWAEVRDLLHEGWVTEARVRATWAAARDARGPVPLSAAAQGVGADALDLAGFVLFVQLMEELRLEAELAANHGLVLADGAAVCV